VSTLNQSDNTDITAEDSARQLEQAIAIAVNAHRGQRDKSGAAYVLHVLRVLLNFDDPVAMQAAVLHDVVEDTPITIDELAGAGIHSQAVHAVELLTRQTQDSNPEKYAEYVIRIKSNTIARSVKLADLRDNYRIDRVAFRPAQTQEDLHRIQKYLLSYQFLTDQIDIAEYRARMLCII